MSLTTKADDATQHRQRLLGFTVGKWVSQTVSVCAELGIADILQDGPRSAAEIATVVGASEDAMFRLLRALASLGLLASEAERFALTEIGAYLRSDVPGPLRGWARSVGHDITWRPWGEFAHSIRAGKPAFDKVFGELTFEYLSKHADAAAVLKEAMTSISGIDAHAVINLRFFGYS